MEFIEGDQGSGRSSRLAREIAAATGPVLLVDPVGSWRTGAGSPDPSCDVVVVGRQALSAWTCATSAILGLAKRVGAVLVAIDDGESLVAGRTQWAALGVALRDCGVRLVVVVPAGTERVCVAARQARGRARLLSSPRPA